MKVLKWTTLSILITLTVIYCLFPFIWTVITAIKPPEEVFKLPVEYLPHTLSIENFQNVLFKRPFFHYILNSLITGTGGTALCIIIASFIAFWLRNLHLEKAIKIQKYLLAGAIVPPTLLVIPIFLFAKTLGLINNYAGLILAYTFLNLPFAIWLLHAGFRKVPMELDYSAMIDGFSRNRILFRIIFPLAKPTIAVTSLLLFIFCWNEFLIALTLMPNQKMYTVPVGIAMLSGSSIYEIPWGEINAAVTITVVPVILIIAGLQKWILEGLTSGAVKG